MAISGMSMTDSGEGSARVFVHIVTFRHAPYIRRCVSRLHELSGFFPGEQLVVRVTDNASDDATPQELEGLAAAGIEIVTHTRNLGFCAAHNAGFHTFLERGFDYYLCLNPDVALHPNALRELISALSRHPECGTACPKLLRANPDLTPIEPRIIDAAGIYMTPSLRHFDRGSGEKERGQFEELSFVFGGSGACLLLSRAFVSQIALPYNAHESDLDSIYPELRAGRASRVQVFDEAFFAYREDADLAWRAQEMGWGCLYVPRAIGYHVRVVTPERRAALPAQINLLGVRNRFLLQFNHYRLSLGIVPFIVGYLWRNLLVLAAVVLRERSSLSAWGQLLRLFRRAQFNRAYVTRHQRVASRELRRWFSRTPVSIASLECLPDSAFSDSEHEQSTSTKVLNGQ